MTQSSKQARMERYNAELGTNISLNFELAERLLNAYQINKKKKLACFVGFDGFTDEILEVVDQRISPTKFISFKNMSTFAARIADACQRSCNIELVIRQKKIGGNGPILALALAEGGHSIELAATIGEKKVEALFRPLVRKMDKVHLLGPSGHSEALEFQDGKVILGRHAPLLQLTAEEVIQKIGFTHLKKSLNNSQLFVSANWTMLPMMNDLWEFLITKILPTFPKKKRAMFVDLADPAKRTVKDLKKALKLLKQLQKGFQVYLGLNHSEADQVAEVLHIKNDRNYLTLASSLQKKLKLEEVILHHANEASGANSKELVRIPSFYTPNPFLNTGAGDNFNAGFCTGLLFEFPLKERLLLAAATAGFYIRKGKSPTMEELAFFLRSWNK